MIKETKTKNVTIRMTLSDYNYLKIASYMTGQTPSNMMRQLAQSTINAVKIQQENGVINIEDYKSIINN